MNNVGPVRVLVSSVLLAFACTASAQSKSAPKVEEKKLLENEKVLVTELHYKPGAENNAVPANARVVRALTSGTLERRYPDGKKENVQWKAGDTRFNGPPPANTQQYTVKNVGKTELVLYIVVLK